MSDGTIFGGFVVTIDGCPFYFTTQGITGVTSTNPNFPRGATCLHGYAVHPSDGMSSTSRLVEEVDIVTGDCTISSWAQKLHDKPIYIDGAYQHLMTWLTTRSEDKIPVARLVASMTDTDTSFTVQGASALAPYIPGVVWIDREAILCSAINTGTGVVTVDTDGRGYYGTRALYHTINAELGQYQDVFGQFPWVNRRRMIIWECTATGNVGNTDIQSVWIGNVARPRLDSGGVLHEIQGEHVKKLELDRKVGQLDASTNLRGFNANAIFIEVIAQDYNTPPLRTPVVNGVYSDLISAVQPVVSQMNLTLDVHNTPPTQELTMSAGFEESNVMIYAQGVGFSSWGVQVNVRMGLKIFTAFNAASDLFCKVSITESPAALVLAKANGGPVPISNVDGVPLTDGITIGDFSGHQVVFRPTLRGIYSEDSYLVLTPAQASPVTENDLSIGGGPSYYCTPSLAPRKEDSSLTERFTLFGTGGFYSIAALIDRPIAMQAIVFCASTHWLAALRNTMRADSGQLVLSFDVDDRNWVWNTNLNSYLQTIAATEGMLAARSYYFDGNKKFSDYLLNECKVQACVLCPDADSRLQVVAITLPTAVTTTFTVTIDDFPSVTDRPTWERYTNFPVNRVKVSTPKASVSAVNQRSVDRYEEGRTLEGSLENIDGIEILSQQPIQVAIQLFSRVLGIHDRPIDVIKVPLKYKHRNRISCMQWLKINEWLAPNSRGGRGNTDRYGLVFKREIDYRSGRCYATCLCFAQSYGFAPTARVSSIAGAVLHIAGPGYLRGVTDYAGSEKVTYLGAPNDGGTGKFSLNDKIRLILRDSTTKIVESFTIAGFANAVDPGLLTITLTGSVPTSPHDWPSLCSSGIVDVEYDVYSTCTAAQKLKYAFWGSASSQTIGGTSDPTRAWSP